jgi:hypothetical protein
MNLEEFLRPSSRNNLLDRLSPMPGSFYLQTLVSKSDLSVHDRNRRIVYFLDREVYGKLGHMENGLKDCLPTSNE